MIKRIIKFFATGEDKPLLENENEIKRIYEKKRWSVLISLILGYGFFYTCRLGLSVAKKPILDAGVLSVSEMGLCITICLRCRKIY